jgi:hypothetical protein
VIGGSTANDSSINDAFMFQTENDLGHKFQSEIAFGNHVIPGMEKSPDTRRKTAQPTDIQ